MHRVPRTIVALVLGASLAALAGGSVLAADPGTMGQPNQSCEDQPTGPAGITSQTNGFATVAVNVYANPGAASSVSGNPMAVSQYDVACFQVSQAH